MRKQPPAYNPDWDLNLANFLIPDGGHKANGYVVDEIPASNMLNGKLAIDALYIRWLQQQLNEMQMRGSADTDPISVLTLGLTKASWRGQPTQTSYSLCAFDGQYLWLFKSDGHFITVDPAVGTTVVSGALGVTLVDVCFDGLSMWVTDTANNALRLSLTTGAVIATVACNSGLTGICFDGTYIWVICTTANTVQKISTGLGTEAVVATVTMATGPTGRPCYDGTHVWISIANGGAAHSVQKVNVSTNAIDATVNVTDAPDGANYYVDGYLWIGTTSGGGSTNIRRINVLTNAVETTDAVSAVNGVAFFAFDGRALWGYTVTAPSTYQIIRVLVGPARTQTLYSGNGATTYACFDGQRVWIADSANALMKIYP